MTLVYTRSLLVSYTPLTSRVAVYLLDCKRFLHLVEPFKSLLSVEEQNRSQRFLSQYLGNRFIVQHGITRQILGYHLQTLPEKIEYTIPQYGKPQVNGLHFNISHSEDYLAVAISKEVPVGVDIESINRNVDQNHVAAIVLSDEERRHLSELPDQEKKITLFRTWVCKEAYWKYVGEGLNGLIKQFEVFPTPEENIFIVQDKTKSNSHRIQSFSSPVMGVVGAVAYQGVGAEVIVHTDELPMLT